MDEIADKFVHKYRASSCEQLWQQRGQPKSQREQEAVQALRNDPPYKGLAEAEAGDRRLAQFFETRRRATAQRGEAAGETLGLDERGGGDEMALVAQGGGDAR